MSERRTNNGNCYQCGKTFGKTAMKNHLLKEHNTGEEESFLLEIKSADYKDFWLYVDIPKSKKIEYIDKFLRDIWLECCGHMSRFAASYNNHGNIGKTRTIGTFKAGDAIYYEYDMGTPTGVEIKFIGEIKRPKQTNSVRLLARNVIPELYCAVCGKPAKFICSEYMYDPVGAMFCKTHAKKHKHSDMMLPFVNSPRNGECGYTGDQDLYGFTGDVKRDYDTSIGKLRRYMRVKSDDDESEDSVLELLKSMPDSSAKTLMEKILSGGLDESDLTEDNLLEMFSGLQNNLVTHGKPVFTLKEVYERKSVAALREIAEMEELKNYSKLKKNELIKLIIENHVSTDEIKSVFLIMTEDEFQMFADNLEKNMFITDKTIFDSVIPIASRVFVVFAEGEKYICVIPQEIKELYKKLAEDENILEKRRKSANISKYASAAVNLYGIIEINRFTDIFNEYNGSNVDHETMDDMLTALSLSSMREYSVHDDYVIHCSLYDSPEIGETVEYLADLKADKPYYIPSNEEFLKYEDSDYYEETSEVKAFKWHLKKNGFTDAEEFEEVFIEMIWSIKNSLGKPLDFIRILNEKDFEFKTDSMTKKAMESAMEMYSSTRMWINNGYSPNEISSVWKNSNANFTAKTSKSEKPRSTEIMPEEFDGVYALLDDMRDALPLYAYPTVELVKSEHMAEYVKSNRIGRNELCSCGSGKKYKKCCGR